MDPCHGIVEWEQCKLQSKGADALKFHLTVPDTEFCKLKGIQSLIELR